MLSALVGAPLHPIAAHFARTRGRQRSAGAAGAIGAGGVCRPLQFVTLEDEHGFAEVALFPETCPQVPYLTLGPYVASGTVEEQHGVFTLTARSFERVEA
jgi:hypothetical protein